MNTVTVLPNVVDELSVQQLAALPVLQKLELQRSLAEASAWLKRANDKFAAALEAAYGETSRAALRASGRDFGTAQGRDGSVEVTFELAKKVKWDQPKLHAIAERIVASGEKVESYIKAELSVSETKWKSWPPVLQEQFAPARTVEPGRVSITLRLLDEEAR
jgi:hypothetical protein